MNILITNDDGIDANGIEKLAEVAKKFGEVWVIAPDGQRSAMSHRVSYFGEIIVKEYDFPVKNVHAFSCSGTPADCVRVGVLKIMKQKPDIVFSGINHGYNMAGDIQYSGTVAAALEAAFWKIPAIAFSRDMCDDFSTVDKYIEEVISKYIKMPLKQNQIWNVNFPNCKVEECKGFLENVSISYDDFYQDEYSEKINEDGSRSLQVVPNRNWKATEGTDLYGIINNYVTVGIVNNVK